MSNGGEASVDISETYDNFDPKKDAHEWSNMLNESSTAAHTSNETGKQKSFIGKLRILLNSHMFHIIIIWLVVLDCLFVAGELIIDYIEIDMTKSDHSTNTNKNIFNTNERELEFMYKNATGDLQTSDHNSTNMHMHEPHDTLAKFLKVLENICKYGSVTVLSVFVIEIVVKLLIMPKNFCKVFEIFDALVVLTSFSLNLYLLITGIIIHSLSGLITLLR